MYFLLTEASQVHTNIWLQFQKDHRLFSLPVFWYYHFQPFIWWSESGRMRTLDAIRSVSCSARYLPVIWWTKALHNRLPLLILHRYHKDIITMCISSTDIKAIRMIPVGFLCIWTFSFNTKITCFPCEYFCCSDSSYGLAHPQRCVLAAGWPLLRLKLNRFTHLSRFNQANTWEHLCRGFIIWVIKKIAHLWW